MTRKRGAPPGNTNALKHGFYSRQFRKIETEDLDAVNAGLADEIALLRVCTRRLLEASKGNEDAKNIRENLMALGLTASRISGLVKAQALLGGHTDETMASISAAIAAVVKDWPVTQPEL